MSDKYFNILLTYNQRKEGLPDKIKLDIVKPFEKRAIKNHGGQDLSRLNERGGLDIEELYCVLTEQSIGEYRSNRDFNKALSYIKELISSSN